ncbi:amidase [Falsiroseomonas sp. CW058]|uniref:amidase n=1 Tax=Falsiroseomonas sp. CW058 TaxID=3388664 RepID=UPI003D31E638
MTAPERLGAAEARRAIAAGRLTATALLEACLERIAARDGAVAAWAFLDPGAARARARALDAGPDRGPLHGLPIGVKDIIDTHDQPAEYGSAIHAGHRPGRDSASVASARAAGAVVLGKTVTTEFANRRAGATRNPLDAARTPGGSSSGSAAAVADFQVPLALGTQTGGSVLRPAAYCGVVGFKPSFGHLGNGGVRANTEAFDTVGLMARGVEDVALLHAACLEIPFVPPGAAGIAAPRIAICRTPHWDEAAPGTHAAVTAAALAFARAGAVVGELDLPPCFAGLRAAHETVCSFEAPRNYADELARAGHLVSADFLAGRVVPGGAVTLGEFRAALRLGRACRARMDALMEEHGVDVLLTPAAPGEAPRGLADTGAATFNYLWTHLHMPCLTLPAGTGPAGMPLGVQLVARRHEDAALLAVAAWAEAVLR